MRLARTAAVALGGGLGATARVGLAAGLDHPWEALVANVAGCLLLAVVSQRLDGTAKALWGTGVAGALTTFSTFAVDAVELAGRPLEAVAYVAVSLTLGLAAVAVGRRLARPAASGP